MLVCVSQSITSEKPCVITFQNKTDNLFLKIYWSNYDGEVVHKCLDGSCVP